MIERVERADDPRIAPYAAVGDHRTLVARGLFVAEGRTVVRRLIDSRRFDIESIATAPAALDDMTDVLPGGRCPVYVCAPEILEQVTGFDFHRGCLAIARRPPRRGIEIFRDARSLLVLEGVGNPDNVGGLFRVASAFGVDGVVLAPTVADPFYRKAIRTSMGAVLRVPFAYAQQWPDAIRDLKDRGFMVVAFTPRGDAPAVDSCARDVAAGARLALLFGAEGPGLSPTVLQHADRLVRIPIAADVDSLNVTVAAGIALAFLRSAR